MRRLTVVVSLVLTMGCGGQGGLQGDVAGTLAPWLVVDLASGEGTPYAEAPDLTDPVFTDRCVVFRRITAGGAVSGQTAGSFARQTDEVAGHLSHPDFYVAALELTRAQWRRLAGTEPWRVAFPPSAADRDDLPALCLTFQDATHFLVAWHGVSGSRLALPTPTQWEAAARVDGGIYPWGDDHRPMTARVWAVTAETGGRDGPQPVGSLRADARGLHDLCGNAWELTADGGIRGGGWCDALSLARPANRVEILPDTPHEGVGVRLVYVP